VSSKIPYDINKGLFAWFSRSDNNKQTPESQVSESQEKISYGVGGEHTAADIAEIKNLILVTVESAETAKENGDLQAAEEKYEKAINQYEQASEVLDTSRDDSDDKLDEGIGDLETKLDEVIKQRKQSARLDEILHEAERSFQEAIIGYANGSQTISKTRFRQARDAFAEAMEIVDENSNQLLDPPVRTDVSPQLTLSTISMEDISHISSETLDALSASDVETIHDLDPVTDLTNQQKVNNLGKEVHITDDDITVLTILSWLDASEPWVFETTSAINQRYRQAKYGFKQT